MNKMLKLNILSTIITSMALVGNLSRHQYYKEGEKL